MTVFKHSEFYHFTTYTYVNLNGAGNANVIVNINHGQMHSQWHFMYFGYSKALKKAYIYIKWIAGESENTNPDINHYLLNQHYFILGRDIFGHNWYSGMYAHVTLTYGNGAYQ